MEQDNPNSDRHFGPLLPKINGKELGKFIYLHLSPSEGQLKLILVEDEIPMIVYIDYDQTFLLFVCFVDCPYWSNK